eukprot:Hpha_TRINITY_DN22357_c0_g1::TRINITY_DN22357_c0_g1_i1::g.177851::m.177851
MWTDVDLAQTDFYGSAVDFTPRATVNTEPHRMLSKAIDAFTAFGNKEDVVEVKYMQLCGSPESPFVMMVIGGMGSEFADRCKLHFCVCRFEKGARVLPCEPAEKAGLVNGDLLNFSKSGSNSVVVVTEDNLLCLTFACPPPPGEQPTSPRAAKQKFSVKRIVGLPTGGTASEGLLEVAAAGDQVLRVAMMLRTGKKDLSEAVYGQPPPPWDLFVWPPLGAPAANLLHKDKRENFEVVTEIPGRVELMVMSDSGTLVCVLIRATHVKEEAERADWWAIPLESGSKKRPTPRRITFGAYRCESDATFFNGDDEFVYLANHSRSKSITTHMRLHVVPTKAGNAQSARAITPPGECVTNFGVLQNDPGHLFVTYQRGLRRVTEIVNVDKGASVWTLPGTDSVCSTVLSCGSILGGALHVYDTEDISSFCHLVFRDGEGTSSAQLPGQLTRRNDVREVQWKAESDGKRVDGVVMCRIGLPNTAPVVVVVHGGPSGVLVSSTLCQAHAARGHDDTRSLLAAGYRVLIPAYRGSAGFGDEWQQASIGCQGDTNGDLGDILSGVNWLREESGLSSPDVSVGIVGGSYGGFMVIRALAVAPEVFSAGVAHYPFVDNAWMAEETQDRTWSREYHQLPDRSGWLPSTKSDLLPHLHRITAPLLILHGTADGICPCSQSVAVWGCLQKGGKRCALVTFAGEGHGFNGTALRNSLRRTTHWFQENMPFKRTSPRAADAPAKRKKIVLVEDSDDDE